MDAARYREDFLWFTYFGVPRSTVSAKDGPKDDALAACIDRAYRDASRTMEYTFSTEGLKKLPMAEREDFNAMKERFRQGEGGAGEYLAKRISGLLESPEMSFDEWHEDTCGELVDKAARWQDGKRSLFKDDGFTYGHAQKWVNMALKNMLVMGLWDDGLGCHISDLHVPIDSYILAAAAIDKGEPIFEGYAAKGLGIASSFKKWSGITNYEEYREYQDAIRNALGQSMSPIEWEGPAWIAQAKSLER